MHTLQARPRMINTLSSDLRNTVELEPDLAIKFCHLTYSILHVCLADQAAIGNEHEFERIRQEKISFYSGDNVDNLPKFLGTGWLTVSG